MVMHAYGKNGSLKNNLAYIKRILHVRNNLIMHCVCVCNGFEGILPVPADFKTYTEVAFSLISISFIICIISGTERVELAIPIIEKLKIRDK